MEVDPKLVETCSAPTNIACIKYWGKKSVELNTPINSSVSVTLSQTDLRAETSVAASILFVENTLWLNGKQENVSKSRRFHACLSQVKSLAQDRVDPNTNEVLVKKEDWHKYKIHVVSRNTFPTAAGLASSAAGYACLVFALAKLFNAKEHYPGQLSAIARQGSGSACRSLYGGFVRWEMGQREDGTDSHAVQIADEKHWSDLCALILVVSDDKKDTSSTAGMGISVATSPLLAYRAAQIVQNRLERIEKAYKERDFQTFGELTMKDSNQFHATCVDTYPPIFYMNQTSKIIIRCVHAFNDYYGRIRAAYTFDAGPNAVIYLEKTTIQEFIDFILFCFPAAHSTLQSYIKGPLPVNPNKVNVPKDLRRKCSTQQPGALKMIYFSEVGGGPKVLDTSRCLMDLSTGRPKDVRNEEEAANIFHQFQRVLSRKSLILTAIFLATASWYGHRSCKTTK